jgi:hypothetical protein
MSFIEYFHTIGIVKDVCRFVEADSVSPEIRICLIVIPLEAITHRPNIHTPYTRFKRTTRALSGVDKNEDRTPPPAHSLKRASAREILMSVILLLFSPHKQAKLLK